jgi:serine/threonine protein kinase
MRRGRCAARELLAASHRKPIPSAVIMGAELAITPPTACLARGAIIDGRYEIVDRLAYGAMGIVYRAWHRRLGIPLALKAMRSELGGADFYERFAEEARNAALLKSEHVARVFDFGRLESGELYLVMELLEGEDLASLLASCGALPKQMVVRLALQACDALGEAHAAGIVHRDLKPENLFLARMPSGETRLKLLDFGVSKRIAAPRRHATITGAIGSPSYMAPEQLRSQPDVDNRADIWALGSVLYELLAGRPAFGGDTVAAICVNVLTRRPAPLSQLRPSVGPELSRVIGRCLEPERADRYHTMRELARALEAASAPAPVELPRQPRRHLGGWLAALALLALGTLTGAALHSGPGQSLELARQLAVERLVGGARVQQIQQTRAPGAVRMAQLLPAPVQPEAAPPASGLRVSYRPRPAAPPPPLRDAEDEPPSADDLPLAESL